MQFENIRYLFLLAAVPLIVLLFYIYLGWRKGAVRKLGDEHLLKQLMHRFSVRRKFWKLLFLLLAFSSFVVALANLRTGSRKEKVKAESSEIFICFDVSNSMLAEDVKPNRLTQAKFITSQLVEELEGNKIGLIVFAGKSYMQMPLTRDARAAFMYLNTINTGMVPTQGTAIGTAIETALEAFESGGDRNTGRAIIIITDGESHDENAVEMAQQAAEDNIKIITIGVGTVQGAPIPEVSQRGATGYKKDREGNIILTKLNEQMLLQLASSSNGKYLNIKEGRKVSQTVRNEIAQLDKTEGEEYEYTEFASHFQVFLILGLIFMTAEFFMSDKKPLWLQKIKLFNTQKSNAA
jgi:Ca-activated chloride channel family protein